MAAYRSLSIQRKTTPKYPHTKSGCIWMGARRRFVIELAALPRRLTPHHAGFQRQQLVAHKTGDQILVHLMFVRKIKIHV